jgi:hypothetical protein
MRSRHKQKLGKQIFADRNKARAVLVERWHVCRKTHLEEVYEPVVRRLLLLPSDLLLRILSFVSESDRRNLGLVHADFRVAHAALQRVANVELQLAAWVAASRVVIPHYVPPSWVPEWSIMRNGERAERARLEEAANESFSRVFRV